jgi:hypothetical protein
VGQHQASRRSGLAHLGISSTARRRPRPDSGPHPRAIIEALTTAKVMTFTGKTYQGARGSIRTRSNGAATETLRLSAWQKKVNRAHTRIRAVGKRANGTLKTWKILTKLRCSPHRATRTAQAILVLHHIENPAYAG